MDSSAATTPVDRLAFETAQDGSASNAAGLRMRPQIAYPLCMFARSFRRLSDATRNTLGASNTITDRLVTASFARTHRADLNVAGSVLT